MVLCTLDAIGRSAAGFVHHNQQTGLPFDSVRSRNAAEPLLNLMSFLSWLWPLSSSEQCLHAHVALLLSC
jgi:hypothetical protein